MADIRGIKGFTTESISKLIAAYGNDLVDVDANTGYGLAIDGNRKVEFEVFLESLFFQNFNDTPLTFDGSNWTRTHVGRTPIARYLKEFGSRMYLGYVQINSTNYPSRIWYSDLPKNDTIKWGIEWGSNGATTTNTSRFKSADANFIGNNIKVGDPLLITSGDNAGEYTVAEAIHDNELEVTETFQHTATSQSYWAGGNYFDVRTDNNDIITWLGENNDRLLVFKQDSLHRYDGSSLRTIKNAPGTTSGRSVVNMKGGTIYFHGSSKDKTGFYFYDGITARRLSNAIHPDLDGMGDEMKTEVVGWKEGDVYRAYLGDIYNDDENIDIDKAVVSYDFISQAWSVDPIADVVKCATTIRESNIEKTLLGNDSDQILYTPSGFSHAGNPIHWGAETQPSYPRGPNIVNIFTRVAVISRKAGGINVSYKLWNTPYDVDDNWTHLGDLEKGRTEFIIPQRHNAACGISYRFEEIGTTNPNFKIESISTYSYAQRAVTPEIRQLI